MSSASFVRELQELGQYGKRPIVSSCRCVDYEIGVVELCALLCMMNEAYIFLFIV